MSDRNKNKKESLSEIIRYKQRKMTGEERNSFERELQKDPFAEEAAEGFDPLSSDEISADISILSKRIRSKTTGRRRFAYYSIAASIAVLMIISTLYIVINKSNTTKQISENAGIEKPAKTEEKSIPAVAENQNSAEEPAKSENKKRKEESKQVTIADASQGAGAAVQKQDVAMPPVSDQIAEKKLNDINASVEEMKVAAPMASRAAAKAQIIADSDLDSLNEVVVVGYGAKKTENEDYNTPSGYTPPQPVVGRSAFNTYIEENINRPDTGTAGQRVVVVINFTVLLDGSIDSIKIVRSPGKPFSDEAIRLIKSGPKWKPALDDGNVIEDEVKVRIVFK